MRRWFGAPVARAEGSVGSAHARGRARRGAGGLVAGVLLIGAGACIRPPVRGLGLEKFGNCDAMVRYLKDAALARVGPYGLSGGGYYRGGPVPGGGLDHGSAGNPQPTS